MLNIREYKGYKIDVEILSSNGIISQKRVIIYKESNEVVRYKSFARNIKKDYQEEIDAIEAEHLKNLKEIK